MVTLTLVIVSLAILTVNNIFLNRQLILLSECSRGLSATDDIQRSIISTLSDRLHKLENVGVKERPKSRYLEAMELICERFELSELKHPEGFVEPTSVQVEKALDLHQKFVEEQKKRLREQREKIAEAHCSGDHSLCGPDCLERPVLELDPKTGLPVKEG